MALTYGQIRSRYRTIMPKGDRAVTIAIKGAATTTLTGIRAHRMPLSYSRMTSGQFNLDGTDVMWRVARNQQSTNSLSLSDYTIGTQDTLTDGSDVWTIKSATLELDDNEWRLVTTKQR